MYDVALLRPSPLVFVYVSAIGRLHSAWLLLVRRPVNGAHCVRVVWEAGCVTELQQDTRLVLSRDEEQSTSGRTRYRTNLDRAVCRAATYLVTPVADGDTTVDRVI